MRKKDLGTSMVIQIILVLRPPNVKVPKLNATITNFKQVKHM